MRIVRKWCLMLDLAKQRLDMAGCSEWLPLDENYDCIYKHRCYRNTNIDAFIIDSIILYRISAIVCGGRSRARLQFL